MPTAPPPLQGLPKPRLMLTIHSMANSGEVRQDEFMATGVHGEVRPAAVGFG